MNFISDLKTTLVTPSKKRNYIFIGIAVFVVILLIIIIVAASSSSSSKSKKKLTPFESYIDTKKYLYVYSYPNAENFLKFVVDHKYSKVFLCVGRLEWHLEEFLNGKLSNEGDMDAKELIKKLKGKKIDVELLINLNDKPDDFTNIDKLPQVANALSKLQKELKFTALHFDIEPNDKNNYETLLQMYEECRKKVKVSAIIKAKWLDENMTALQPYFNSSDYFNQFKDCETFAEAIVKVTDYSDIMAFSNNYSTINQYLDKYKKIIKKYKSHNGKPILELEKVNKSYSTYQRYKEDNKTFFNYFTDVSDKFDGVVIHHYTTWYQGLYCEIPEEKSIYYYGEPKVC